MRINAFFVDVLIQQTGQDSTIRNGIFAIEKCELVGVVIMEQKWKWVKNDSKY